VPAYDTTRMEFCLIRKAHSTGKSHHCQFSATFLRQLLPIDLSGGNCRSSNSATSRNRGDCNSDRSYVCEHVARGRTLLGRVSSI
jgi:hypothetical protein